MFSLQFDRRCTRTDTGNCQTRMRSTLSDWWPEQAKLYAGSYLVWIMIGAILLLWAVNVREVVVEYQQRMEQRLDDHQQRLLASKADTLEEMFRAMYEHARTISLLPSVRSVQGGNRQNETEDALEQGRLSLETHQTIEQVYKNLANSLSISEIYYVLDGFAPERGEVPFFMYDNEIVGVNDHLVSDEDMSQAKDDVPEEYEMAEYLHYQQQLQRFSSRYASMSFNGDITTIPALSSPLLRTCDNTQYNSVIAGDVNDSYGLLYSIPVFDLDSSRFKGLISVILRANVLEASLVGVPFIPVTMSDSAQARAEGWWLPEQPSDFLLLNGAYDIAIHDRRNSHFSDHNLGQLEQMGGRIAQRGLNVTSDGEWQLYHHLSAQQARNLTTDLSQKMWLGIAARAGVLLVLLLIFWRANRDQLRHHQELVRLAHYDTLTMLPNRTLMYQHLQQSIQRADRHQSRLG